MIGAAVASRLGDQEDKADPGEDQPDGDGDNRRSSDASQGANGDRRTSMVGGRLASKVRLSRRGRGCCVLPWWRGEAGAR